MVIQKEVAIARQFALDGKRDKAKVCLQKKRFQEQLVRKAEDTMHNVEELVDTIEFTAVQSKVFESLKVGTATLKELQSEVRFSSLLKGFFIC